MPKIRIRLRAKENRVQEKLFSSEEESDLVKNRTTALKNKWQYWKQLNSAEDFRHKNQRLLPLLISTNKLKDFFKSKEAVVSAILSISLQLELQYL